MKDFSLSLHKQSLSTIRRRQWISEAIAFRVTQCLAFFYISLIKLKLFDEWIFNVPHSLAFLACFCDLTTVDKQRSRKLKFVQLFCPAGSLASLAKSTRCERPSRALSEPFINSIVFPKKKSCSALSFTKQKEEENEARSPECLVEFTFYGNLAFSCALAAFCLSQCQKWSQFNVYTIKTNIKGHKGSKNSRRKHEEAQHKEFLSHRSLVHVRCCPFPLLGPFQHQNAIFPLVRHRVGFAFFGNRLRLDVPRQQSFKNILNGSWKHDDRCRRSANGHSSNYTSQTFLWSSDTIQVPASILDSLRSAIS